MPLCCLSDLCVKSENTFHTEDAEAAQRVTAKNCAANASSGFAIKVQEQKLRIIFMSFQYRTYLPFAFALALIAAFIGCNHKTALDLHSQLRSNLRTPQATEPILLAAYQPWFGHSNHINVGYSSQDPNVL